jgi:hypothetical protein
MNWRERLVEKWKKFVEDAAKDNDQMWKGETPSCGFGYRKPNHCLLACCAKDKNKEFTEER